jgi:plasmid stabilization system protein ParE
MSDDYDFHPEALLDLEDIWQFIADDNAAAADRVISGYSGDHRKAGFVSPSRLSPS